MDPEKVVGLYTSPTSCAALVITIEHSHNMLSSLVHHALAEKIDVDIDACHIKIGADFTLE